MGRLDFSDGDFSPGEDGYRGFDLREEESARGPLILALAVGVLVVFAAVIWNTYRQGVRADGAAVPLLTADAGPYKRPPVEAGGEVVPGTDKRLYDQIDGSARDEVAPAPLAAREDEGAVLPDLPDKAAATATLEGGPVELRPGIDVAEDAAPVTLAALGELRKAGPDAPVEMETAAPTRAVAAAPAMPDAAGDGAALATLPAFDFAPRGIYLVQIAALRSEQAADTAWASANREAPDLFVGAEKRIQRADLGAKGVFFRLRAGAFATREEASAFCGALKDRGRDCIVVQ